MKLNEKLMKIRKEKGLSQEEFGNEINVSRQAVSKWENGETKPDVEKLQEIGKKFNISFDYLLNDELDEPQPHVIPKNNKKFILKIVVIIVLVYLLICLYKFIAFYRFFLIANSFSEENYQMVTDFQSSNIFNGNSTAMFFTTKSGNEIIEYTHLPDSEDPAILNSITYTNTTEKTKYTLDYDGSSQKYYYREQSYDPSSAEMNYVKETTLDTIPSNFKNIFLASINPCYFVSIFNREITYYSLLHHAKQRITLTNDYLISNVSLKTEYDGNVSINYSYDYVPGHFKNNNRIENPLEKYKDMIIYE